MPLKIIILLILISESSAEYRTAGGMAKDLRGTVRRGGPVRGTRPREEGDLTYTTTNQFFTKAR